MDLIQHLQSWVDYSNLGIVIALALSFFCGGASIYLSKKLNSAKDSQNKIEMQTATTKIEEAKAIAAEANRETARLAKENTELRTDLESATAEARRRQSELTIEQKKLADSQQKLADAERKRAEAQLILEKTLEDIRKQQEPRTLTEAQRSKLLELLRSAPKGEISITCILGDGEGYAFALEIDGLLKSAGWSVNGGGVTQAAYTGGYPIGLSLIVHKAETAPLHAVVLQRAFTELGVPLAGAERPELPEGIVELIVGRKPDKR